MTESGERETRGAGKHALALYGATSDSGPDFSECWDGTIRSRTIKAGYSPQRSRRKQRPPSTHTIAGVRGHLCCTRKWSDSRRVDAYTSTDTVSSRRQSAAGKPTHSVQPSLRCLSIFLPSDTLAVSISVRETPTGAADMSRGPAKDPDKRPQVHLVFNLACAPITDVPVLSYLIPSQPSSIRFWLLEYPSRIFDTGDLPRLSCLNLTSTWSSCRLGNATSDSRCLR